MCRAILSEYIDKNTNENIYVGRSNLGAVSLNLPMIYMEAFNDLNADRTNTQPFFKTLDKYLEQIRQIHIKTFKEVGKMKASSNPLCFMEGGLYGGHLKANDSIEDVIKTFTVSFGVTALNELTQLHLGMPISQDNSFAVETIDYILKRMDEFKQEDGILYALYGTPAESLQGTQVQQFRKKYGIIKNVSDKDYFTNSFHVHVSEDIDAFTKQDKEQELFHMVKGGHIGYARINPKNKVATKTIVRRAMDMGLYYGTNFSNCLCEDCGHHFTDEDKCPKCGSENLTVSSRITGYLGWEKTKGTTTYNDALIANVKDRVSM